MKRSFLFVVLLYSLCFSQEELSLPDNCSQLILVVTDSISSTNGRMMFLEKNGSWPNAGHFLPVVLGKNGLGWGRGLHNFVPEGFPVKKEGDGRSPAGMFKVGAAFGFAQPEEMKHLKIPYIHITDMLECVDDAESKYYNQIVYRDSVENIDWNSSEKMHRYGRWYEQGIIIEQNTDSIINGAGSCIFIHNWVDPDETSMGCTEMNPSSLKDLIKQLDESKNPVFVQLPNYLWTKYWDKWGLPKIAIRGGKQEPMH